MARRRNRLSAVSLGLPGLVFSLWSLWSLGNVVALSAFGKRDEGELTKEHLGWTTSHVKFDPVTKSVELTGRRRFGKPLGHRIGTRIPVVYWEGRPETARWNNFGILYVPIFFTFGIAMFFTTFLRDFWPAKIAEQTIEPKLNLPYR